MTDHHQADFVIKLGGGNSKRPDQLTTIPGGDLFLVQLSVQQAWPSGVTPSPSPFQPATNLTLMGKWGKRASFMAQSNGFAQKRLK
ncbi:hypothetical protein NHJ13051_008230 [Beauveria bassiana]